MARKTIIFNSLVLTSTTPLCAGSSQVLDFNIKQFARTIGDDRSASLKVLYLKAD